MASGGIRRFAALASAALACVAGIGAITNPWRPAYQPNSAIEVGRCSYARKGKRTAAQQKRAARKKRNRK